MKLGLQIGVLVWQHVMGKNASHLRRKNKTREHLQVIQRTLTCVRRVTLQPLAAGGDDEMLSVSWLKNTGAQRLWGGLGPWQHTHTGHSKCVCFFTTDVRSGWWQKCLPTLIDSVILHNRQSVTFFHYKSPGMPEEKREAGVRENRCLMEEGWGENKEKGPVKDRQRHNNEWEKEPGTE